MKQRQEILLKEKAFKSKKDLIDLTHFLNNFKKSKNKNFIKKYSDLLNEKKHTLELINWLEFLTK